MSEVLRYGQDAEEPLPLPKCYTMSSSGLSVVRPALPSVVYMCVACARTHSGWEIANENTGKFDALD